MNVIEYLRRIQSEGLTEVSLKNLTTLQINHLRNVPFEFCDIHSGHKHISFSLEDAYERIVNGSRGGWCFQLNGVFAWLLTSLGYKCHFVSVRPRLFCHYSPHMAIIVELHGRYYYTDTCCIGYVAEPLEIATDKKQVIRSGTYRFVQDTESSFWMMQNLQNNQWVDLNEFQLTSKGYKEFKADNEYAQSPEHAPFYMRSILSMYTETGAIRLVGNVFTEIEFRDGTQTRTEPVHLTTQQVKRVIRDRFRVSIDELFEPIDEFTKNPMYSVYYTSSMK